MPVWKLEAFGTEQRGPTRDVRHRSYTTSKKRAEEFERIPRIQFTDSGHGIVFTATLKPSGLGRDRTIDGLRDYIREQLAIIREADRG